jgi:hypothetical protein
MFSRIGIISPPDVMSIAAYSTERMMVSLDDSARINEDTTSILSSKRKLLRSPGVVTVVADFVFEWVTDLIRVFGYAKPLV